MVAKNNSNEIRIIRTYDAPLPLVWDAWNDPEQAAKWWGPRGFTITTHGKDLRPGGFWSYTMHGPDGVDYVNKTLYHEVELHKKLVYDHGGSDDRPPLFRVTVLFSEQDGKTTMDMSMRLPTAEEAEKTRQFIKAANGNSTWDRLGEYLASIQSGKCTFVINRSFDVSAHTLFEHWAEPSRLAEWLPASEVGELELLQVDRATRTVNFRVVHPRLSMPLKLTAKVTPEQEANARVTLTYEAEIASPDVNHALEQLRTTLMEDWNAAFDNLELWSAAAKPQLS